MDINSVIGDIYDGSADGWLPAGESLFHFLGANGGSLRFPREDGRSVNVFELSAQGEESYSEYYCRIDPVRSALTRSAMNPTAVSTALVIEDLVARHHYRHSEFYQDFAKQNDQHHMLLGMIGDQDRNVIGFFRDGSDFGDKERAHLSQLLPHIRRAIDLRKRLQKAELAARLGYAALEALPASAIVVNSEGRVVYANSSAARHLSVSGLPLSLSTGRGSGETMLSVDNRGEAARLRALISNASFGGRGGAMRFERDLGSGRPLSQIAVFVLPLPAQFSARTVFANEGDPVLVLLQDLSRPAPINPGLLTDLFALSSAESAVALALLGGQTAEAVARERQVSLETVRTQIRVVLRKTGASNLRDFERIGALLTALFH